MQAEFEETQKYNDYLMGKFKIIKEMVADHNQALLENNQADRVMTKSLSKLKTYDAKGHPITIQPFFSPDLDSQITTLNTFNSMFYINKFSDPYVEQKFDEIRDKFENLDGVMQHNKKVAVEQTRHVYADELKAKKEEA